MSIMSFAPKIIPNSDFLSTPPFSLFLTHLYSSLYLLPFNHGNFFFFFLKLTMVTWMPASSLFSVLAKANDEQTTLLFILMEWWTIKFLTISHQGMIHTSYDWTLGWRWIQIIMWHWACVTGQLTFDNAAPFDN